MKRKFLIIAMVITTSITTLGCLDNSVKGNDKVLDSIVLDDDVIGSSEKNTPLGVKMIAKTEGICGEELYNWGSLIKDKVIFYSMKREDNNVETQFPNWKLDTVKVGEIEGETDKNTGLNSIQWQDKDIDGMVLQDFNNSGEVRIIKDNKGYKFNSKGELEEITAYKSLIEKYSDKYSNLETYVEGTIDLFTVEENGEKKVVLIDNVKDSYYEIDSKTFSNLNKDELNSNNDRRLTILGIENNKIYVSLEAISSATYMRDTSSIIGYIEDDKFTIVLSSESGINVNIIGGAIYSNGRILFSGYAEDKNGIWNYDVNAKKLVRQIYVSDGTLFNFSLNPTKDKIILSGVNYESGNIFTMNLASINENLEIANLTNIVESNNKGSGKVLEGWSEDGTEFYLYTSLQEESEVVGGKIQTSYEVYRIGDFSVDIKSNSETLSSWGGNSPFLEFTPIIKDNTYENIQYHWIIDKPNGQPFEMFVSEENGGALEITNNGEMVKMGLFAEVCYVNTPERALPTYFDIILNVKDVDTLEVIGEKKLTIENRAGEYKIIRKEMTEKDKEEEVLNTIKRIVFDELPEDIKSTLDSDYSQAIIKTEVLTNDVAEVTNDKYIGEEVYAIDFQDKDAGHKMNNRMIYVEQLFLETVGYGYVD